jgi:predicted DNA-binding transcriptional regulator AlpA
MSVQFDNSTSVLPPLDCVRTIKQTAKILGIGEPSLRNMISKKLGPKVTRLSARRIGIRDSHRQDWLDAQQSA